MEKKSSRMVLFPCGSKSLWNFHEIEKAFHLNMEHDGWRFAHKKLHFTQSLSSWKIKKVSKDRRRERNEDRNHNNLVNRNGRGKTITGKMKTFVLIL